MALERLYKSTFDCRPIKWSVWSQIQRFVCHLPSLTWWLNSWPTALIRPHTYNLPNLHNVTTDSLFWAPVRKTLVTISRRYSNGKFEISMLKRSTIELCTITNISAKSEQFAKSIQYSIYILPRFQSILKSDKAMLSSINWHSFNFLLFRN